MIPNYATSDPVLLCRHARTGVARVASPSTRSTSETISEPPPSGPCCTVLFLQRSMTMAHHDIESEHTSLLGAPSVYPTIMAIRKDVCHYLDTPLTSEQLLAPDLTYSLVRPLANKYARLKNMAVPFCFLINRVHFLRDQNFTTRAVSISRANLCELLAIRTLRDWVDPMDLATVLVTSFDLLSGASPEIVTAVLQDGDEDGLQDRVGNAIELAIISQAKRFIKSSPCQKVISAIWRGEIVYQAESAHAIISDTYKRRPIYFYDYRKAPLLDHYRLKVPAVRSVLEYMNFVILFILFIVALEGAEIDRLNIYEASFMVYAAGFNLEKLAAMQEHGLKMFSANLWNFFDLAFMTVYVCYAGLRVHGLRHQSAWAKGLGIDFLAIGACLMFPRLAFATLSNNLMILSLRSMLLEFTALMLLAAFCFGGFLYALWTLGRGRFSSGQVAWWMLDIWFGLDATGFDKSTSFHPIFGPILMVIYACLSNTLLLTVLVSILSNTFATINADALAESLFRRAVTTVEGVKVDALFSYLPPLNLIAFLIMFPASYILSPRWFHKINVTAIRLTSFPILLAIAFYERQIAPSRKSPTFLDRATQVAVRMVESMPRRLKRFSLFEGFAGPAADIDAIFEIEDQMTQSADGKQASTDDTLLETYDQQRNSKDVRRTPSSRDSPGQAMSPAQGKSLTLPQTTSSRALHEASVDSAIRRRRHSEVPGGSKNVMKKLLSDHGQPTFTPLMRLFQPVVEEETVALGTNMDAPKSSAWQGPAQGRREFPDHNRSSSTARPHRHASEDESHGSNDEWREPQVVRDIQENEDNDEPTPRIDEELKNRLERMEAQQTRLEELLMEIAGVVGNSR
ncbi:hypothetical protein CALVIDRAFT_2828 [Calocera viscosa TUFC12733]|uniref:Receptor-activated Ca2+-permeable cation channel n=1 Tax=Calocera viscosa (strain TUFC12733) TaxID=1330018 RepID=A0A167RZQ7_CALVF|nr:hypothetical protein CALVIDRAFT_2828 [Calocera viscosa TUFC12733]